MPDPGFLHDCPWALPAACQPSLQRGVRGVSPRLKKRVPPPSSLAPRPLSLALSFSLSHSLLLLPFPWLLFSRTLLTRQADPPYPAGGPPLPGRRQAGTPYLPGPFGRRALLRTREADTSYSGGGYFLRGGRILLVLGRRILLVLGRRVLVRACLTQVFSHHRPRPDVQAGPRAPSAAACQADSDMATAVSSAVGWGGCFHPALEEE